MMCLLYCVFSVAKCNVYLSNRACEYLIYSSVNCHSGIFKLRIDGLSAAHFPKMTYRFQLSRLQTQW